MLTEDDLKAIAALLESYGMRKPPSAAALRMQRMRERQRNGASQNVTPSPEKRNGSVTKRNGVNGHRIAFDWESFAFTGITPEDMRRWQEAYPALPVPDLIDRAAIWLKANPKNRKSNYERFLTGWLTRAQDRSGRVA